MATVRHPRSLSPRCCSRCHSLSSSLCLSLYLSISSPSFALSSSSNRSVGSEKQRSVWSVRSRTPWTPPSLSLSSLTHNSLTLFLQCQQHPAVLCFTSIVTTSAGHDLTLTLLHCYPRRSFNRLRFVVLFLEHHKSLAVHSFDDIALRACLLDRF